MGLILDRQFLSTGGSPLVGGMIFIGKFGEDPFQAANKEPLFREESLINDLPNPVAIDSKGYPEFDIYVTAKYSVGVREAGGDQHILNLERGTLFDLGEGAIKVGTITGIDDITGATDPVTTAYQNEQLYTLTVGSTNTGAVTLDFGAGEVGFKRPGGGDLLAGQLVVNQVITFNYNSTAGHFQMVGLESVTPLLTNVAGTNVYTADVTPAITAYIGKQEFSMTISNTNTGAVTLNLGTVGARALVAPNGASLLPSQLLAGKIIKFIYNADDNVFQLIGVVNIAPPVPEIPDGLPVGAYLDKAGPTNPAGYVLCDGSTYDSIADPTFAALFSEIGTNHGGSGASDFKVPRLNGRMRIAADNLGGTSADVMTNPQADILGGTGGSEKVSLTSSQNGLHSHSGTIHAHSASDHTHSISDHSHSISSHSHTLPNHTHVGGNHTHSLGNHTHSLGNHTHSLSSHTHSGNSHDHSLSSHTHVGGNHTHGGPSHTHQALRESGSLRFSTDSLQGRLDNTGQTGAAGTGATSSAGAVATSSAGGGNTGTAGTGQTGSAGSGNTGSAGSGNTGAATGSTGSAGAVATSSAGGGNTGTVSGGVTGTVTGGTTGQAGSGTTGSAGGGNTGVSGSGTAHNNDQPWITCTVFIKK